MGGILRGPNQARGQLLIEVLIALALMGVIAVVFIGAMYTALQSARIADERSIALTLAQSEIEYVKRQPFSDIEWAYTVDTTDSYSTPGMEPSWWSEAQPPPLSGADFVGYSVSISGLNTDFTGIRKVTAIARHHGEPVITLENFERDREPAL
jgi:Tfp pilus assembly protein PilV